MTLKKDETITYDLFDPEKAPNQIKSSGKTWKGQIYYKSLTSEYNDFYPLPEWWSNNKGKGGGRKWMEIEELIGDFHFHNINKGFLQNILINVVGDPDAPIPEDEAKKAADKPYTTVEKDFQKYLDKRFAGAEGDKALVMWAESKEQFADIKPFPSNTNHDLFQTLQTLSTENICIAWQVPPVLIGVKTSGTLSKDDIANAIKLMISSVEDDQNFLEEVYNELFPLIPGYTKGDIRIMNYSPINSTVDPSIWAELSTDEKRKWINDNTDIELDAKPANN